MRKSISPSQTIAMGFLVTIIIGTFFLMLPISTVSGESTGLLEALFTATSSVCVTGLVLVDTGTYWSSFGQFIILMLIQVGGLGFMTMATFAALIVGRKIGIKSRTLMQESLGREKVQGIVVFTKRILLGAFTIEAIGALLLSTVFIPQFGLKAGIWRSIFHAISAFCNAGLDIMGGFQSFMGYQSSIVINLTICTLIFLGGIGFAVIEDVWFNKGNFKRFKLHSKIVLITTVVLIGLGLVGYFILEFNNPGTMKNMTFLEKVMASLFQSITPRTAGFNTIDQDAMTQSSKFLTIMLMFIGGSPASTAGGVKTTVLAVVLLSTVAYVKKKGVGAFNRRIGFETVNKATAIMFISFTVVVLSTMVMSIDNPSYSFITLLFEVVSAFGTVGLSLGITASVTTLSKWILIMLMFLGRIGALTFFLAIAASDKKESCRYPEGNVII